MAKPIKTAYCFTCDKKWEGMNAQAVGAQHARKHGHAVGVDVVITWLYDGTKSDGKRENGLADL